MGGESWCTIKDFQAPFSFLKTGDVDHLLVHMCLFLLRCDSVFFYYLIFLFRYFSELQLPMTLFTSSFLYMFGASQFPAWMIPGLYGPKDTISLHLRALCSNTKKLGILSR